MVSRRALRRGKEILANQLSRRAWRGWRHLAVNQGWRALPIAVFQRLQRKLHPSPGGAIPARDARSTDTSSTDAPHPFDREYDVDTGGLIWGENLPSGSRNDAWNTAYYGIAPSIFRAAMSRLPERTRAEATFIDIGSGKGRALMMAAQFGFRRVIGVEISPELHRIAGENAARFAARHPGTHIDPRLGDAAEFIFPSVPLVLFLYQPFCRPVMARVLRNLSQSLEADPREVTIVYVNPELRGLLEELPWLECLWRERVAMDAADCDADRIGANSEECAIYRAIYPAR